MKKWHREGDRKRERQVEVETRESGRGKVRNWYRERKTGREKDS